MTASSQRLDHRQFRFLSLSSGVSISKSIWEPRHKISLLLPEYNASRSRRRWLPHHLYLLLRNRWCMNDAVWTIFRYLSQCISIQLYMGLKQEKMYLMTFFYRSRKCIPEIDQHQEEQLEMLSFQRHLLQERKKKRQETHSRRKMKMRNMK